MDTKTKIGAALIAAILASAGGAAFLQDHPNPTLREVYIACETPSAEDPTKGKIYGMVCCEDMNKVTNVANMLEQCGLVQPGKPDPFGIRKQLEDEWDKELKREQTPKKEVI